MRRPGCPCKLRRTRKGHDRCIANLPKVQYACCGHFNMRDKYDRPAIPYLVFIIHPSLSTSCREKCNVFQPWKPAGIAPSFTELFERHAAHAFDELQLFHGSKK